jgi:hypothetical protein
MPGTLDDTQWKMLLRRIAAGRCTPFLGAGAAHPPLPLGSTLAKELAEEYQYPFENPSDLIRVAQYVALKTDPRNVKDEVLERIGKAKPPDFSLPNEPHSILADLPIPIYLTTNYDDFMMRALLHRGKQPKREMFRWYSTLVDKHVSVFETKEDYTPTPEEPVVFHLHGHNEDPHSLVLTEDDYLDFLVNVSSNQYQLPHRIKRAFSDSTLLFIGYSLADWSFRVLFQGLLRDVARTEQLNNFLVQMLPLPPDAPEEERRRVQHYLDIYFQKREISVYWGTAAEFCQELRERAITQGVHHGS